MFQSVAILGRQPALGIAELESLYGSELVQPFGDSACFIDKDACSIDFNRLGGSLRLGTVLLELPSVAWKDIEAYLVKNAPHHAAKVDGKLSFGISVFGLKVSKKQVSRTALLMKKAIKASGKSVRMIPHNETPLNTASVLHNKLHKDGNWELLVISDGSKAYLAQTNFVQDIDAYVARDRERPMRDAKVGMLPPKLAQIIINLAVGKIDTQQVQKTRERAEIDAAASSATRGTRGTVREQHKQQVDSSRSADASIQALPESSNSDRVLLLDPFCGTGVTLQEAMLMDYDIYGSDINPRMVEYTIENLKWLDSLYPDVGDYRRVEIGDATNHSWHEPEKIDVVAGESFLGQPLTTLPPSDQLSKIMAEANTINHKFLQNIAKQLKPGTRICLAVPTWRGKKEFLHLSALDYLDEMGYTRMTFKHVSNEKLIYHRENQVVGRELLVLEKK